MLYKPLPTITDTRYNVKYQPHRDRASAVTMGKKRKVETKTVKDGSNEPVLLADIKELLARSPRKEEEKQEDPSQEKSVSELPEKFSQIDLEISSLSSTGDGLALSPDSSHVYVVPFAIPGDTVTAKVITHFPSASYSLTDFVKVVTPSSKRDDSRIGCKYFAKCSGCQFQMLSYEDQLVHKKTIVEKAYRNFSGLNASVVPKVGETIGSPLQYGYRTKLTPHFDGPPGAKRRKTNDGKGPKFEEVPPIGFMVKGTRWTMDIEDCPIGTDAVRGGMARERKRVAEEIDKYKKGATILLRESTKRIPAAQETDLTETPEEKTSWPEYPLQEPNSPDREAYAQTGSISKSFPTFTEERTCITDNNATSTEYIDSFVFHNRAGEFFQNNNSILPRFTAYVREHALPPTSPSKESSSDQKPIKYLIDAYSGSGLFTITLSSLFKASLGIDISANSIASARENAKANNVDNAHFMAADASALFAEVKYDADEAVVVIDPPRKGCDENFLNQLLRYGPRRVIYVSCNVHTQARDVGVLVNGKEGVSYEIESLRGFDFFPQTGHVEGVAVLNRCGKATV